MHDPGDPIGKMFFGMLALMAEFESDLIRSRTVEGMREAAKRGRLLGKPSKLSVLQRKRLLADYESGEYSAAQRSGYRGAGTGDVELLQVVHCRMLPSGGALGVSVEEAGGDGADRAHDGGCVDTGLCAARVHPAGPPLSASREHARHQRRFGQGRSPVTVTRLCGRARVVDARRARSRSLVGLAQPQPDESWCPSSPWGQRPKTWNWWARWTRKPSASWNGVGLAVTVSGVVAVAPAWVESPL